MKNNLSILIPIYNDSCTALVAELQRQAELLGIDYEIIVADDGSTDQTAIDENRSINDLPHCRYIERGFNSGRAAIRNFLTSASHGDWLLFIDGDMTVDSRDFLNRYLDNGCQEGVIDGGVCITGDCRILRGNLRFIYEKAAEEAHSADNRNANPYRDFHTANFMAQRSVMLDHPFDLRFRRYGYEDVLFGKTLQRNGIPITHIDNPLSFERFETNAAFVEKTEEGLRTLCRFREELRGYNRLLTAVGVMQHIFLLMPLIRLFHQLFGRTVRRQLCSDRPSLRLFNLYRIAYFASLLTQREKAST